MYLEVTDKCEGMHPSERLIEIDSVGGTRQAFYHGASILWGNGKRYIDIGNPIDKGEGGNLLVDIGREMTDGSHRVWVSTSKVFDRVPLGYNTITWGYLKAMVEKAGAKDDTPIDYIDLHKPTVGGTAGAEVIGGNLKITEM